MFSPKTRLVKNERISGNFIEDEVVLLDSDEAEVIRLNPVGAEVWRAVDGERTIDGIATHVAGLFDGDPHRTRKDVLRFLKKLLQQEIVLPKD